MEIKKKKKFHFDKSAKILGIESIQILYTAGDFFLICGKYQTFGYVMMDIKYVYSRSTSALNNEKKKRALIWKTQWPVVGRFNRTEKRKS